MKSYAEKLFWCTHGGIGGAPWFGDHPKRTTQAIDEANAAAVGDWMREQAATAGIEFIPVKPVKHPDQPTSFGESVINQMQSILDWRTYVPKVR